MLQRFKCGFFRCRKKCDIHIVRIRTLNVGGIIVHILNTLLWTSHLTTGFILDSVSMLHVYFSKNTFYLLLLIYLSVMSVNRVKQSSHTAVYFTYITCWLCIILVYLHISMPVCYLRASWRLSHTVTVTLHDAQVSIFMFSIIHSVDFSL